MKSTLVLIDEENEKENLNETIDFENETNNSLTLLTDSDKKNENEAKTITAENFTLPNSTHLMKWLNKIGNDVSKTPIVLNLVSKLKALVKEIDYSLTNLNFEIDTSLKAASLCEKANVDSNTSILASSSFSDLNNENENSALNC